jgi:hypothetical protein
MLTFELVGMVILAAIVVAPMLLVVCLCLDGVIFNVIGSRQRITRRPLA